jgi:hypothetical protein
MKVYIYISEATNRTIITSVNHGRAWEMKDGEVYDLLSVGGLDEKVLICDGQLGSAWECKEVELA